MLVVPQEGPSFSFVEEIGDGVRRRRRPLIVVALVSMPSASASYLLAYHLTDHVSLGIFVGLLVGMSINLVMSR